MLDLLPDNLEQEDKFKSKNKMANLNLIPIRYYDPGEIYHYKIDNRPLEDLAAQVTAVNSDVELIVNALADSSGDLSSLSSFLNVAHNPDGSLKVSAIDDINSSAYNSEKTSIEDHVDTDDYVRMTAIERSKLNGIVTAANSFLLQVNEESAISGTVSFEDSSSVEVTKSDNTVTFKTTLSHDSLHAHYYDEIPTPAPDGLNAIFSVATAYIEGSLRVYLNGIREVDISELDPTAGVFEFTSIIPDPADSIRVDYNIDVSSYLLHIHWYNTEPVVDVEDPQVFYTPGNIAYFASTLRVYLNGVREPDIEETDPTTGTFTFATLTPDPSSDEVRIDFNSKA